MKNAQARTKESWGTLNLKLVTGPSRDLGSGNLKGRQGGEQDSGEVGVKEEILY